MPVQLLKYKKFTECGIYDELNTGPFTIFTRESDFNEIWINFEFAKERCILLE